MSDIDLSPQQLLISSSSSSGENSGISSSSILEFEMPTLEGGGKRPPLPIVDDNSNDDSEVENNVVDQNQKQRKWFLTIFNHTKKDVENMIEKVKKDIIHLACCEDLAPKTGRYHIHVCVWFHNAKSFKRMKTLFDTGHMMWLTDANWFKFQQYTRAMGKNEEKNKLKKPFLVINPTTGDYKSAIKQRQQELKEEFYDEWHKDPNLYNLTVLLGNKKFYTLKNEMKHCILWETWARATHHKRNYDRIVIWIYGNTRQGKSYFAHTLMDEYQEKYKKLATTVSLSNTSGQVIGYKCDEMVALFDDIKLDKVNPQELLQLLDNYPETIDTKGGFVHYDPDIVMVTCIEPPNNLSKLTAITQQLLGRLTFLVAVPQKNQYELDQLKNPGAAKMTLDCQGLLKFVFDYYDSVLPRQA